MRRSFDRLARDRWFRLGQATVRSLTLAGLVSVGAVAGDDKGDGDLPDLSPPTEMKIISRPMDPAPAPIPTSQPIPSPKPARPSAPGRAVLAIPGLTSPPTRSLSPVPTPKPSTDPTPGDLSLEAPIEMRPTPEALPGRPTANSSRSSLPLILESSTDNTPSHPARKPATTQTSPMPMKRRGLFGVLGGSTTAPTVAPSTAPRVATPGRALAAEDPEAESALKRRIERQAREVVGNRARSVEVKLDGKEAVVRVSEVKLFQKRAIRKQLEGIPALSGLRSTIEILD